MIQRIQTVYLLLSALLLGLMFFFAITPADVVLFVNNQYQKLQQARQDRAEEETAYDTQLFAQEQEEEPIENLTAPVQDNRPHHPAYDVIADTGRIPVQPAQPVQPLVQQAAPVNQPAQPVQPATPSQPAASAPVMGISPISRTATSKIARLRFILKSLRFPCGSSARRFTIIRRTGAGFSSLFRERLSNFFGKNAYSFSRAM